MGVQSLCKQFSFIIGQQPCMPCIPLPASICHDFHRTVPQDVTVVWFSFANKNVIILSFILWYITNMPFWYTREQIFLQHPAPDNDGTSISSQTWSMSGIQDTGQDEVGNACIRDLSKLGKNYVSYIKTLRPKLIPRKPLTSSASDLWDEILAPNSTSWSVGLVIVPTTLCGY